MDVSRNEMALGGCAAKPRSAHCTRYGNILGRFEAIPALAAEGFLYRRSAGVTMFLDGPDAKTRDAVHVVFAGKKVRDEYPEPVPNIDEYELIADARTLPLERLVRMKLTSFRDKDRVYIRDMISIGIIDESWLDRLSPALRVRLEELLNDPDG